MPSAINRVPPALLSLLDIKAGGQNPQLLADQIAPTLELLDLYLGGIATHQNGNTTAAVAAPGITAIQVVLPAPGELLVVTRGTAAPTAVLGAATTIRYRLGIYDVANSEMVYAGPSTSGATGERPLANLCDGPVIVGPGQALAVFCEQFAGVAPTIRFSGTVARLRI